MSVVQIARSSSVYRAHNCRSDDHENDNRANEKVVVHEGSSCRGYRLLHSLLDAES